mgnify:CR=1 FL=1
MDYDAEQFFGDYEIYKETTTAAHIGYDRDLETIFVEYDNKRVAIDETDIATVEKLLDGFDIPFTERLGQVFWRWDGRQRDGKE